MKSYKTKTFLLAMLSAMLTIGCDSESIFTGQDNFVSAFQLVQDNETLTAAISEGSIVITAPENLSLNGATATVVISENATITPDPTSITEWDDPQTFVVTSFNGTQNTYQYTVERISPSHEGDITLLTQAHVETLAAMNPSQINGKLIIGAETGTDSIYSLASLAGLKVVKHNLIINPTFAGENLDGLQQLETAGAIQIVKNAKIINADLPKLKSVVTDMIIDQSKLKLLNLPELENVDKALQITTCDSLVTINWPKLKTVVENLTIKGGWSNNKLQTVALPALEKVGGVFTVSSLKAADAIDAPMLKSATAIDFAGNEKVASINMPRLETVFGNMTFSSNQLVAHFDVSSLQSVGGNFRLEAANELENMDGLKSLTNVGGEFQLYSLAKLKNIQGLKALKSVGGRLYLSSWPMLDDETLNGISGIETVGGDMILSQLPFKKFASSISVANLMSINGTGTTTIEEIDVRNATIGTSFEISSISTDFVLKGKEEFDANLSFQNAHPTSMIGFDEVMNLKYSATNDAQLERTLNIGKVNGNLEISVYNFDALNMPFLREVVGTFTLNASSIRMGAVEMPSLQKIGGNTTMEVAILPAFSLPALKEIGGNCNILTGRYSADVLADLQMPSLTTINGTLSISGYSSYYTNSKLTNLDGFASLRNVEGITVSFNSALSDYTGLRNAIASFGEDKWSTSGCAYNPSYQDMLDGKYTPQP